MNISSFLRQSAGKIKPIEFLKEHKDWLKNLHGCIVPKTAEQTAKDRLAYTKVQESINYLLNQVDKRAMMPTPALVQIGQLLVSLPAPPTAKVGKPCNPNKKPGKVFIDEDGNEIQEVKAEKKEKAPAFNIILYCGILDHKTDPKNAPIVKSQWQHDETWKEKTFKDAEGKACRLLFKHEDSIEAHIIDPQGLIFKIKRGDAVAKVLKVSRGPICKPQVKSSQHGWGIRSKAYKIHFSKG